MHAVSPLPVEVDGVGGLVVAQQLLDGPHGGLYLDLQGEDRIVPHLQVPVAVERQGDGSAQR